jgi:hypothetical protein
MAVDMIRREALVVDVRGLDRIVLSGGFDDKAALMFDGLSRRPGPKRIRLFPGEAPDEVLWEEVVPEPVAQ